ncbi:MAG TPA: hypothetical protein VFR81_09080 [Longimicrobium sp.]|nr:hypothetical protein [Longimicrobium sp.]
MIFSNVVRVHERGFHVDAADIERIGVFDKSVCWGVWVPDPRGNGNPHQRKHLLISPIHPSVWPFLLRLEIKLRDAPGRMAVAAAHLFDSRLNIQLAESAISGHHHATWNVVAEAVDVRGNLTDAFVEIQRIPDADKVYLNPQLEAFANRLAAKMFAREVQLPKLLIEAHRKDPTYNPSMVDSGFLHNRIVDKAGFYDVSAIPRKLKAAAERGLPQAVTCRWMQNLAFFAVYGDMASPIRLQYDESAGLLKLPDAARLDDILERQGQPTTLPANGIASFDTSELYLRIDIVEPTEMQDRYLEATVDYDLGFASTVPGQDDTASGFWLSVCEEAAREKIDLVKISNRTTDRDYRREAGSIMLIGKTSNPMTDSFIEQLDGSLSRECRPRTSVSRCKATAKTSRFRNYTIFLSRRTNMPRLEEIEKVVKEIAARRGFTVEVVKDNWGELIDEDVEKKVLGCDAFLQIISYSEEELDRRRNTRDGEVLPQLRWLFHEYGLAIGAGKPHIRMFDIAHCSFEEWKRIVSTRSSESAGEYKSDDGSSVLSAKFEKALANLAHKIDKSRRSRLDRARSANR